MKITKIEKKKRLYLVEIDKKESLYVTEDTIVKYMLTKEMALSKDQLEDIKNFAQFSHGKNLMTPLKANLPIVYHSASAMCCGNQLVN